MLRFSSRQELWIEWSITVFSVIAVALTAYNVHPVYVYAMILSNAGWLFIGFMWRKSALIVIQLVVSAIYISGLINYYTT